MSHTMRSYPAPAVIYAFAPTARDYLQAVNLIAE